MNKPFALADIDIVVFDLDGTIYYGPNIIPGANDTIGELRRLGVQVFFATNNSTKLRQQIYERLQGMGVDCRLEEVLTSGYLAAQYAKLHKMKDIYIFGSKNLVGEFEEAGVLVTHEETAENLLIGYDPNMTYEGLSSAVRVALQAKCIMACNRERTYPGKDAKLLPGCGAMVAPVEWCARRECDVIIGKPNPLMMEYISQHFDVNMKRILMVGDTYESDVRMAFLAGCKAVHISKSRMDPDTPTIESVAALLDLFDKKDELVGDSVFHEAKGVDQVAAVWDVLGDTHSEPLRDQVDDIAAYINKLSELGITYTCKQGKTVVGGISFYANDDVRGEGFISHVAVAPKRRRNGIGTELVNRACEEARRRGMGTMRVDVPRTSEIAKSMLGACGFTSQQSKGFDEVMIREL